MKDKSRLARLARDGSLTYVTDKEASEADMIVTLLKCDAQYAVPGSEDGWMCGRCQREVMISPDTKRIIYGQARTPLIVCVECAVAITKEKR